MRRLGRYVLLSRIATGSLGDVFLARRDSEGRDAGGGDGHVAVKVIRPELSRDLRFARLLFAEGPASMRFAHASVARVLEVDRDGSEAFVAMELASGQPLSTVLKRALLAGEPLEHRLACWIGAELASALGLAHATPWFQGAPSGMVHGAIAPRGIVISYEGQTKLLGLGLGRARAAAPLSPSRLAYSAPELLEERDPTPRADAYSLGVVLYDALSGKQLFRRASDDETRAAIREGRIPPLSPVALRVDPSAAELISRMITPRPDARLADLAEIERVLRAAATFGGHAEESPAKALERRMRGIFAGEMLAEQRVVLAAKRQPEPERPRPKPSIRPVPWSAPRGARPGEPGASAPESFTGAGGAAVGVAPSVPSREGPRQAPRGGEVFSGEGPIAGGAPHRGAKATLWTGDLEEDASPTERGLQDLDAASTLKDPPTTPLGRGGAGLPEGETDTAVAAYGQPGPQLALPAAPPPHPSSADVSPGSVPAPSGSSPLALAIPGAPPPPHEGAGGASTLELGIHRRVARYLTEAVLARSPSTVLFRARDPNLGRAVALKVMDPEAITDTRLRREDWTSLFKREARIAGRFEHPGIARVYDAGRDAGVYFMASALVDGEPLSDLLARGQRLSAERLRGVVRDLALALDHVHERGVIHGDLRAANVLLTPEGRAILLDFSLSSEVRGPEHPLLAANVYAFAPEYLSGFGYSARSDQFALGMLLYQLATGVRPFDGADDRELAHAIEQEDPRPPEAVDPTVDAVVSELTMRLLEKDPALRFERAGAAALHLDAVRGRGRVDRPRRDHHTEETLPAARRLESGQKSAPRTAIVDPELDPALTRALFAARGEVVEAYADLDAALAGPSAGPPGNALARDPPAVVVVASADASETRGVRRRVLDVAPESEVRVVPPLALRLLGPALSEAELSAALAAMYERAGALLEGQSTGFGRGPAAAARSITRRIGGGARAELLAPLVVAARSLAARLRLSAVSAELASVVPPEVSQVLLELEQQSTEPPRQGSRASLLAQIVGVVETYYAATAPPDGHQRVSPRRAILELRERSNKRVREEIVDALVEHLRETISALELGPLERPRPPDPTAGAGGAGAPDGDEVHDDPDATELERPT